MPGDLEGRGKVRRYCSDFCRLKWGRFIRLLLMVKSRDAAAGAWVARRQQRTRMVSADLEYGGVGGGKEISTAIAKNGGCYSAL